MNEQKISVIKPKLTAKEKKEERARQNKLKQEQARAAEQARGVQPFQSDYARVNQVLFELESTVREFKAWVKKIRVSLEYRGSMADRACPCGSNMIHDRGGHFVGNDSIEINGRLEIWRKKILSLEGKIKTISPQEFELIKQERREEQYARNQQEWKSDYISPEARAIAMAKLGMIYEDESDYEFMQNHLREPSQSRYDRIPLPEGCRIGRTPIEELNQDEVGRLHQGKTMIRRYWDGEMIGERKDLVCRHYQVHAQGWFLSSWGNCDCPRDAQGVLLPIKDSDKIFVDRSILQAQLSDKAEALRHNIPPYNVRKGLYDGTNRHRLGLPSPYETIPEPPSPFAVPSSADSSSDSSSDSSDSSDIPY